MIRSGGKELQSMADKSDSRTKRPPRGIFERPSGSGIGTKRERFTPDPRINTVCSGRTPQNSASAFASSGF